MFCVELTENLRFGIENTIFCLYSRLYYNVCKISTPCSFNFTFWKFLEHSGVEIYFFVKSLLLNWRQFDFTWIITFQIHRLYISMPKWSKYLKGIQLDWIVQYLEAQRLQCFGKGQKKPLNIVSSISFSNTVCKFEHFSQIFREINLKLPFSNHEIFHNQDSESK